VKVSAPVQAGWTAHVAPSVRPCAMRPLTLTVNCRDNRPRPSTTTRLRSLAVWVSPSVTPLVLCAIQEGGFFLNGPLEHQPAQFGQVLALLGQPAAQQPGNPLFPASARRKMVC
jgi:hypothetical protein